LASLRLTTTEAETHNERLCAHTLGDHIWGVGGDGEDGLPGGLPTQSPVGTPSI
jgi:hypothetical protein